MGNRSMFVGLDVHKETIDVSIAEGDRHGEVRHYGVIASDLCRHSLPGARRPQDTRRFFLDEARTHSSAVTTSNPNPCACGTPKRDRTRLMQTVQLGPDHS